MPAQPYLFEASWEVCNKVGGIHTVITSKAALGRSNFKDRYITVGPYLSADQPEFAAHPLPPDLAPVASALERLGVGLHFGIWAEADLAPAILLDTTGLLASLNEFKKQLWERYQLDTLGTSYYDIDQPLLWSLAVGMLVEEFAKTHPEPVIAHGHEWLCAGMFLHLDTSKPKNVRSVFTTHATVLGRALSSNNRFIYDNLASINPEQEAKQYGVLTKHQLEALSARLSSVFTTVSDLTNQEAEVFLSRKADVVVRNGLDLNLLPSFDQISLIRSRVREQIKDFVAAYFPLSTVADNLQLQFTMGRYEMHNKGYDTYVHSLGLLNRKLKEEGSVRTVVSFILVPAGATALRPETLERLTAYRRILLYLEQVKGGQGRTLYRHLVTGSETALRSAVPDDILLLLEPLVARLRSGGDSSPVSPYLMENEAGDAILQVARANGLTNQTGDPVKLVFLPLYLDGFDGIFNLTLYELVSAFDLGVFPSLYEPWGYTPLESVALGVPAVTSNLSGFGLAAESNPLAQGGLYLLDRSHNNGEQEAAALAGILGGSLDESRRTAMRRRMDAYALSESFSWDTLYERYLKAYSSAVSA